MTKNLLINMLQPLVKEICPVLINAGDNGYLWISKQNHQRFIEAQKIANDYNFELKMYTNGEIWLIKQDDENNQELLSIPSHAARNAAIKLCKKDLI